MRKETVVKEKPQVQKIGADISKDLYRRMRVYCVQHDMLITGFVIKALETYLRIQAKKDKEAK